MVAVPTLRTHVSCPFALHLTLLRVHGYAFDDHAEGTRNRRGAVCLQMQSYACSRPLLECCLQLWAFRSA